jgi:4-hydroxybenzoate polyprenyltransferase
LVESILIVIRKKPFFLFQAFFWYILGKSLLKKKVSNEVKLNLKHFPLNEEFISFLKEEKVKGRKIILATGASEKIAKDAFDFFGFFSNFISSNEKINLTGTDKRDKIIELIGKEDFSYAGDCKKDFSIWKRSKEAILVNHTKFTEKSVDSFHRGDKKTFCPSYPAKYLLKGLRPHQWVKNFLVFIPVIASHNLLDPNLTLQSILAFSCFCLCASSGYLINDLLDLNADRKHKTKSTRPLASGNLPISWGIFAAPLLCLTGLTLAMTHSADLASVTLSYFALSCLYSIFLKKLVVLDVIALAVLYTIRIYAGATSTDIVISDWLLLFSIFLFSNLALLKRFTELRHQKSEDKIMRRGYSAKNTKIVKWFGVVSLICSVTILALYVHSSTALALYENSQLLWCIVPVFVFWISRMWLIASIDNMDLDPVLFAIKDKTTLLCGLLSALFMIWAI